VVEFVGHGRNETITIAGFRRLRIRPFDPSRDRLTEHEQTDARLLAMYDALTGPDFDTEAVHGRGSSPSCSMACAHPYGARSPAPR
jgi:hypothetical protein